MPGRFCILSATMNDTITARQLAASRDVHIIDIRKAPDEQQIIGSERYDGATLAQTEILPFEKDEPVVLYCGSGNSCSRIAAQLRERGYDARALEGGYGAWKEARLPTEPLSDTNPL
jgi:rhodanese-related sulfurtransferase